MLNCPSGGFEGLTSIFHSFLKVILKSDRIKSSSTYSNKARHWSVFIFCTYVKELYHIHSIKNVIIIISSQKFVKPLPLKHFFSSKCIGPQKIHHLSKCLNSI